MKFRKVHRYLGLFIGIQFIIWTISGMYFSWTNLDEIHGDQFKKEQVDDFTFKDLINPGHIQPSSSIGSLQLKEIAGNPYYLVNGKELFNAQSGERKTGLDKEEAFAIAAKYLKDDLEVTGIERLEETGKHHEYRDAPLPAYVISYREPEDLKAYISINDASFRTVRHRDWRWFDFLWMTHTMDYEGRDNINNLLLRIFSALGLITVLSGFALWYITSPSVNKVLKRNKRK